ncbi:MAG: MFS transporter [Lachnospiraceae bacterium]|nr:MFS transporter [Lachnospiraceae bacterium]
MTKKLTSEKEMRFLCFLCCLAYFMSYLTRLNYAACMVELQQVLGIGKSIAGLPVTMCFLSYGAGQLVCGFLGDRLNPKGMIFAGLAGSAVCNLLVAACPRMEVIIPVWCVNGFFQSMLWPPMVRIMAEMLSDKWYRQSCVLVSMASALATIAIYVLAPVCIQVSGWEGVFILPGALGVMAAFFWIVNTRRLGMAGERQVSPEAAVSPKATVKTETAVLREAATGSEAVTVSTTFLQLFTEAPLLLILLAIILQGTLRDGMTTWMPVYMNEVFGMSSAKSILSAAALPVFGVVSTLLASMLLSRLKSEVFTAALLFGVGMAASVFLLPFYNGYPAVCILMMTLITGCMHGVNLMLISRVPGHFTGFGKVSTVSGILNAATYIGSSLSTYGFGAVADSAGWRTVILLWAGIALLGAVLMLLAKRRWGQFCGKYK